MTFIKRITSALAAALVAISLLPATALAAGGNVSYQGQAEGFVFEPGSSRSASDLFTEFTAVMPGDTLTDAVTVRNTSSKTVNIYLKPTGAKAGSEQFLSQMQLSVKQGSKTLFDATAESSLADWVALGSLSAGSAATLDLELTVPITMDDRFQNAVGRLNWVFKVEEVGGDTPPEQPLDPEDDPEDPTDPDDPEDPDQPLTPEDEKVPEDPSTPPTPSEPSNPGTIQEQGTVTPTRTTSGGTTSSNTVSTARSNVPKTGDSNRTTMVAAILIAACVATALGAFLLKRKND